MLIMPSLCIQAIKVHLAAMATELQEYLFKAVSRCSRILIMTGSVKYDTGGSFIIRGTIKA